MSLQIISRQLIHRAVSGDSDKVIAYVPLPPKSRLNNVWLDVSILATSAQNVDQASMYGLSGFVVAMDDPDTVQGYDTVWDEMIQKDLVEAHSILNIDTANNVSAPEFEVGMIDLYQMFGDNLTGNMQIYQKREILTFPKRPVAYDPSNDTFYAMDAFKVHVRNGPRVESPSVAMFGLSSPGMTETQSVGSSIIGGTPQEKEWLFTMYAEVFLYDLWKHLIGVTPGSGTDPYDDVSGWFAELLEDNFWIEGGTPFTAKDYNVTTKATWGITVPGKPRQQTLTSD